MVKCWWKIAAVVIVATVACSAYVDWRVGVMKMGLQTQDSVTRFLMLLVYDHVTQILVLGTVIAVFAFVLVRANLIEADRQRQCRNIVRRFSDEGGIR